MFMAPHINSERVGDNRGLSEEQKNPCLPGPSNVWMKSLGTLILQVKDVFKLVILIRLLSVFVTNAGMYTI